MGELMSWLRNAGVEPLRVAGLTELVNDPALVRVRRIVVIDWDTNLVDVLRTVAGAVAQAPKLSVVAQIGSGFTARGVTPPRNGRGTKIFHAPHNSSPQ